MIRVIDASVALKWFVDEEGSPRATTLLAGRDSLIAPDLIIPEVCNAAWKLLRRGMVHQTQQIAIATRLPAILDELVPTAVLAPRAAALAARLDHPAYDCFYLALAEQRSGMLISADRRLIERVAGTIWGELVTDLRLVPVE